MLGKHSNNTIQAIQNLWQETNLPRDSSLPVVKYNIDLMTKESSLAVDETVVGELAKITFLLIS